MPYRDPERQRQYKREWARLRRAGERRTPGGTVIPTSFRLQTAQDVVQLIEEEVASVRAAEGVTVVERARTIGYLASIALRAIEAGELAARVEAVEAAVESRRHR